MTPLSDRQRFGLAFIIAAEPIEGACTTDTMTALIRFVQADGIDPEQFSRADERDFAFGYAAACYFVYLNSYPTGSFAHKALTAAGVLE